MKPKKYILTLDNRGQSLDDIKSMLEGLGWEINTNPSQLPDGDRSLWILIGRDTQDIPTEYSPDLKVMPEMI